MTREELAKLIDAYADAKISTNKHLMKVMIADLEEAFDEIFPPQTELDSEPE